MRALPAIAAFAAGVQVATLRQWVRRGHIAAPDEDGCYDLLEVMRHSDTRWTRSTNLHRALAGRRRRGETRSSLQKD